MLKKIEDILRLIYDDNSLVAQPDLNIRELKRWDSFHHIDMMIAVEQAFDLVISPREIEQVYTVSDLLAIIAAHGGESGPRN